MRTSGTWFSDAVCRKGFHGQTFSIAASNDADNEREWKKIYIITKDMTICDGWLRVAGEIFFYSLRNSLSFCLSFILFETRRTTVGFRTHWWEFHLSGNSIIFFFFCVVIVANFTIDLWNSRDKTCTLNVLFLLLISFPTSFSVRCHYHYTNAGMETDDFFSPLDLFFLLH